MTWTVDSDRGMTWRELKETIENIPEEDLDKNAQIKFVYETFHAYLSKSEYDKEWSLWAELRANKSETIEFNITDSLEQNLEKVKKILTDMSFYVEIDEELKLTVYEYNPNP